MRPVVLYTWKAPLPGSVAVRPCPRVPEHIHMSELASSSMSTATLSTSPASASEVNS